MLEAWCCRQARTKGIVVSKLTDPTGIPDRCFWCMNGSPLIVEFKVPGGEATQLQLYYLSKLKKAGYRTAIVTTKEGFMELLNEV